MHSSYMVLWLHTTHANTNVSTEFFVRGDTKFEIRHMIAAETSLCLILHLNVLSYQNISLRFLVFKNICITFIGSLSQLFCSLQRYI